ncbi:MAG: inositol 2-dehydrogenase [Spirochaetes bacterium]|nr:MAG: inositol 2-dehydrogenase [Spirochaetota bacterium]
MKSKINVGIIGAGRIGQLHAENLTNRIRGVRVAAITDINIEAARKCASRLEIPQADSDYRRVMDNPDVDAVIICSSTDTHAGFIEEAAETGKHIFCEKPIALDLPEIDRALTAVKKAGVKLQVGFNRRFDPNFSRIRELIAEGRIGEPHILRITSRDPAPPPIEYVKVSGGLFLDMTIHDFDMARFLIGSEVDEVSAIGGVMIDQEIGKAGDIDTAITNLMFENGVMGTIDNSRKAVYGYDQRVEVFGSAGMLTAENETPNRVALSTGEAVIQDLPLYFFLERYQESYIREMQEFINCIVDDRDPPVSGEDGRMPVVIGKAAMLSFKERRPVKLAEISG